MAHTAVLDEKEIREIVEAKPYQLSMTGRLVCIVLIVVGILAFAQEIFGGQSKHAWTSLHVNFIYWYCLAAAASCFTAVFHICNAQWSRPVVRIFQSALPFFQWSPLVLLFLYFGHDHLFVWAHQDIPGKGFWLTSKFVFFRNILAIFVLSYLARQVIRASLRRDIGVARAGLTGAADGALARWRDKRYDKYVQAWSQDHQRELSQANTTISRYSPAVVIVYSILMSMFAFDLIMSVDPYWYSTLFGAFYFMTAVYLAVAWVAIGVGVLRQQHVLFLRSIDRKVLHDLGKLLFGFGIFWAYLFWSHYLTIWYANIPEETGFIITRLREHPWHGVAWMVLGCCFIIPFWLGLSRDVKQVPALLLATATIVGCGLWIQFYLWFAPTLFPHHLPFALSDLAIALGFMGAFVLSCASFLAKVPLIPFGDLYRR